MLGIGAIVALSLRDDRDWAALRKAAPIPTGLASIGLVTVMVWNGPPAAASSWMRTIAISLRAILFGGRHVMLLNAAAGSVCLRAACSPFLRFFRKYSYGVYVCH